MSTKISKLTLAAAALSLLALLQGCTGNRGEETESMAPDTEETSAVGADQDDPAAAEDDGDDTTTDPGKDGYHEE